MEWEQDSISLRPRLDLSYDTPARKQLIEEDSLSLIFLHAGRRVNGGVTHGDITVQNNWYSWKTKRTVHNCRKSKRWAHCIIMCSMMKTQQLMRTWLCRISKCYRNYKYFIFSSDYNDEDGLRVDFFFTPCEDNTEAMYYILPSTNPCRMGRFDSTNTSK